MTEKSTAAERYRKKYNLAQVGICIDADLRDDFLKAVEIERRKRGVKKLSQSQIMTELMDAWTHERLPRRLKVVKPPFGVSLGELRSTRSQASV